MKKRILFKDIATVIPFGTVLTLPATGSEMNSGAVVTIEATQEKLTLGGSALFPVFSIVDPTVITSLPKRQLQNGVVDALKEELTRRISKRYDDVEVIVKATSNDGLSVTRTADKDSAKTFVQETLKDTWESADEWFVH